MARTPRPQNLLGGRRPRGLIQTPLPLLCPLPSALCLLPSVLLYCTSLRCLLDCHHTPIFVHSKARPSHPRLLPSSPSCQHFPPFFSRTSALPNHDSVVVPVAFPRSGPLLPPSIGLETASLTNYGRRPHHLSLLSDAFPPRSSEFTCIPRVFGPLPVIVIACARSPKQTCCSSNLFHSATPPS